MKKMSKFIEDLDGKLRHKLFKFARVFYTHDFHGTPEYLDDIRTRVHHRVLNVEPGHKVQVHDGMKRTEITL